MSKIRIKNKAKYLLLIGVIVLLVTLTILLVAKQEGNSRGIEGTLPGTNEVIKDNSLIQHWTDHESEDITLSVKVPPEWVIQDRNDTDCPLISNTGACTMIYTYDHKSYIYIEAEKDSDVNVKALITETAINNASTLTLGKEGFLRSQYYERPGYYYDKREILQVYHITQIDNPPTESEYGTYYGTMESTFKRGNISYTIIYLLDPSITDPAQSETVKTMDQILSTLEIEFRDDIFK